MLMDDEPVKIMDSETYETFELPIGDVESVEAGKDCTYIESMGRTFTHLTPSFTRQTGFCPFPCKTNWKRNG